ncbi:MAG: succinate dehydrogenase cytochrome b subunit [Dermatophilaceae bacterium]
MATTTLLQGPTRARRTTVWMKILMASTGALFVFYVLMHMYGNLKLFFGQAAFDEYAHHLREILTPILPYEGFLWLFRALMIVALGLHAYAAFTLWVRANGARPQRYAVRSAAKGASRSTWMRWGGVALLLFVVFHLVQFTISKLNFNPNVTAAKIGTSPYQLVVASFQLWWVVLIYVLALIALGLHLFHGVWSGAQTLGWTTSPGARAIAKLTAHLVAGVVVVGFALPPLAILAGIVKA